MFYDADSFNGDLSKWDVSSVTDMSNMFYDASSFNRNLSMWCVEKISTLPSHFSNGLTEEYLPKWGTCTGRSGKITQLTPKNNEIDISISTGLSWEKDDVATAYQLQIFEGLENTLYDTLVQGNSFDVPTELNYNRRYLWRIRGINEDWPDRPGEWSNYWSFRTELPPLEIIDLLTPEDESENYSIEPIFKWSDNPVATSYEIQVSADNFLTNLIEESLTDTFFVSPTLDFSTTYAWRIRASNDEETGDWTDTLSFTTIIEKPADFTLKAPTNDSVDIPINSAIQWNVSERAEYYRLQVSKNEGFSDLIYDVNELEQTQYNLEDLAYNTTYYWRSKAYNVGGESDWTDTWEFFTEYALETPMVSAPINKQERVPIPTEFRWSPINNTQDYELQISKDSLFADLVEYEILTDGEQGLGHAPIEGNWSVSVKV